MLNINNMGKIIKIKGADFSANVINDPQLTYKLGYFAHEGLMYDANTLTIRTTQTTTSLGIIPVPSGYRKLKISGITPLNPRSCKFCSNTLQGVVGEVLSVINSEDISNITSATIDIPATSKTAVIYVKSTEPRNYDDSGATLTFYSD